MLEGVGVSELQWSPERVEELAGRPRGHRATSVSSQAS